MKVLEEPKERGPRSYTFRCTNQRCQAKMQAREDEATRTSHDPRDGCTLLVFACPRCAKELWIDDSAYDGR